VAGETKQNTRKPGWRLSLKARPWILVQKSRRGVTEIKLGYGPLFLGWHLLWSTRLKMIETYHLKLKIGLNSVILFWDPVVFSQQDLNNFWLPVTHLQSQGRQAIPWSCSGSVPPVKFGYWRSSTTQFFICFLHFRITFFPCQMKRSGFMDFHGFSFMLVQNSKQLCISFSSVFHLPSGYLT